MIILRLKRRCNETKEVLLHAGHASKMGGNGDIFF